MDDAKVEMPVWGGKVLWMFMAPFWLLVAANAAAAMLTVTHTSLEVLLIGRASLALVLAAGCVWAGYTKAVHKVAWKVCGALFGGMAGAAVLRMGEILIGLATQPSNWAAVIAIGQLMAWVTIAALAIRAVRALW